MNCATDMPPSFWGAGISVAKTYLDEGNMLNNIETLSGFVVDVCCLREWLQDEIWERVQTHSRECILQGSHIESGFALIQDDRTVAVLDSDATPLVIDTVLQSENETGIRLRVEREMKNEKMRSVLITEM